MSPGYQVTSSLELINQTWLLAQQVKVKVNTERFGNRFAIEHNHLHFSSRSKILEQIAEGPGNRCSR